ncbi:MAG: DUF3427 domain-containing protein [Prosthecochloris sp.]|nr:DUF3427 domain-containing protein [Prosthecochloris sp.]
MHDFSAGLYDLLHTRSLHRRLDVAGLLDLAEWSSLDPDELQHRLAQPIAREVAVFVAEAVAGNAPDKLLDALQKVFRSPEVLVTLLQQLQPEKLDRLIAIKSRQPAGTSPLYPDTPLSVSALLTGSSRSPALRTQLIKELSSADRADWLVSFIKYSGIMPLMPALQEFTATPSPDGEPRLRIATTSYMGATDPKAIEALLALPHTEVRISYDTRRTRLHAKAYIFHRKTGFGSAYIGSANVSKAALDEGLEWTAKISQYETLHLWQHATATFEFHWEDPAEFIPCSRGDLDALRVAISAERQQKDTGDGVSFFDLRPYGYQQVILDDIQHEREAGKQKHLVIAATGTGKTMIAAFDYKEFAARRGCRPRLLYLVHREEILRQARASFRQVLRDGSFGEIVARGAEPSSYDHLFCTIQSWNSKRLDRLAADHFEYVVLDEAHHASAATYQRVISHLDPLTLLGLTATPERGDGQNIRNDFGGTFTHEIRLPEAIERALLVPFHYYGVPDLEGLDFSHVQWSGTGYDTSGLERLVARNAARARWVLGQLERYVADEKQIRALGFCVSVEHARFMADYASQNGMPAIALCADSSKEERSRGQRQLEAGELRIIFTVDLYNEGVDIPSVDTVLFLRPTESLTIFLQQLGRGLRLHDDKPHLTVLDFIARQNQKFSYARRFRGLTSRPELNVERQVADDMPYLPAGCMVHLERQAREHVLENIRNATARLRGATLMQELGYLQGSVKGGVNLQQIIDFLNLDSPDELYKRGLPYQLLDKAVGREPASLDGFDKSLSDGFRRLLLMDDTVLIADGLRMVDDGMVADPSTALLVHSVLWRNKKPGTGTLDEVQQYLQTHPALLHDLRELFAWLLTVRSPLPCHRIEAITGPLNLHASYSRTQVLHAIGLGSFERPKASREGVVHVPEKKLDIFFADINKSEADFSPTTMYEDYAISDCLFHWQSQSATSDVSSTGQRYINHQEQGYTPLLFIREHKRLENGLTAPYFFAGPLRYRRHEGSNPMSITWELEHQLPARALTWARRTA